MIFWQNCVFIRSNTLCGIDAAASLYCVFPLGSSAICNKKAVLCTASFVIIATICEQAPIVVLITKATLVSGFLVAHCACDSGGIRTHDPQLRRLLLYPTELRNHRVCTSCEAFCDAKITYLFLLSKLNGDFPSVWPLNASYLRLRIRRKGSFITPNNASLNMPPLIFEAPSRRSVNTIDTSPSRRPNRHAVYFISIWKP